MTLSPLLVSISRRDTSFLGHFQNALIGENNETYFVELLRILLHSKERPNAKLHLQKYAHFWNNPHNIVRIDEISQRPNDEWPND